MMVQMFQQSLQLLTDHSSSEVVFIPLPISAADKLGICTVKVYKKEDSQGQDSNRAKIMAGILLGLVLGKSQICTYR